MGTLKFIFAGLRHYRRIHVAVALGVAVATAVLTGALLVGDSVRGSLRDLTLERLGRIDSALVTEHMFRAALADELAAVDEFTANFTAAEPAILLRGTLQTEHNGKVHRATQVDVIGCRDTFWKLGQGAPQQPLAENSVAITEPLARELGAKVGDELQLRIPTTSTLPADSPLGREDEETTSRFARYRVGAILPPRGLARFGLMPSQHLPRNIFVPLDALQKLLEKPGKANAILVGGSSMDRAAGDVAQQNLQDALRPGLADFGLRFELLASPTKAVQITADQLVLPDKVVTAAERAFGSETLQPVVTYLANKLIVGEGDGRRITPYSTISGVDSTAALGPLFDDSGRPIVLADDEIVLNRWAADDLEAKIGDLVTVTFYEPESTHGELRERQPPATFKLRAIVELESPDGTRTSAADPKLTPDLPGVTDQETIDDWELPFDVTKDTRPKDEQYWTDYRTTPKAFVSLATAKRLWKSRWGTISLLRMPADESVDDTSPNLIAKERQLLAAVKPADVGMTFLPVKELGLAAAGGTTPFDGLFVGFSFFLIAAALMLIALLFQLGIEQRAGELGTLAALGFDRKRIAALVSREGLLVAMAGALVGVVAGAGYAWLMIAGLRTWWLAAIATPFLTLHITLRSLILGWLIGVAVSWLTIRLSIRRLIRLSANSLLQGSIAGQSSNANEAITRQNGRNRRAMWPVVRATGIAVTIALVAFGFKLVGQAQAGAFFGSGALTLLLLLGEIRYRLRVSQHRRPVRSLFTLAELSALNTARNPTRSALTIGLVAAATFVIVAISAFRLDTGVGGTGGFSRLATSDRPVFYDLNASDARTKLGFSDTADEQLKDWQIYSLRVAAGEDASCLNLYRPTQPRVLGVPENLVARGGFDAVPANPWPLLAKDLGRDAAGRPIVPVVLDASTAIYSLRLKGLGSRFPIRDAADRRITLEVVGLLANSILQGNLLVSEANFVRLFPDTSGYRFFLIERRSSPPDGTPRAEAGTSREGQRQARVDGASPARAHLDANAVSELLETTLAAHGFDAVDADAQLAGFQAVQNTYLSTFQSLGALGLLLGTIGLAIVQLRSVLERRGELALMRATGFRRGRLVHMVVLENAALLLGGLAVGCIAAAVALVPQWASHDVAIPWKTLAMLLGTIAVVGLAAAWLATRSVLRAPLLPALRSS